MMAAGVLIAVAFATVLFFIWYRQSSHLRKVINRIPGPPALPIIGNAHQFKPGGSDFLDQVLNYASTYKESGICRVWIAMNAALLVYRADTVEVLLNSTKHMSKSREYDFLLPWLGTGLLTSSGSKWKSRRKLLTPTFHFKILNDFLEVFNDQSEILVNKLHTLANNETFDLFPHITMCALDIICDTAMGTNVNAQENSDSDYVQAVYRISDLIHKRQKTPWMYPDFMFNTFGSGHEFQKCVDILHKFTKKVIIERSAELDKSMSNETTTKNLSELTESEDYSIGKRKRLAFLDMLLYASRGEADLSFDDIREEVDTFMFEGHDTTAAAMNWACHLIGAHPDVQKKLHDEQDQIFGGEKRRITMDDIKEMKYLECVIKEALRLFPSVPIFGRTLDEDTVIGGYEVPKNTTALVITSSLHRDTKYFPDPEKFDPDRFLKENAAGRHPFAYIPFSAGMRNCIGQKFAMNEEKVILSHILQNFMLTSMQKQDELRPMGELILRPEHGILVKLKSRN